MLLVRWILSKLFPLLILVAAGYLLWVNIIHPYLERDRFATTGSASRVVDATTSQKNITQTLQAPVNSAAANKNEAGGHLVDIVRDADQVAGTDTSIVHEVGKNSEQQVLQQAETGKDISISPVLLPNEQKHLDAGKSDNTGYRQQYSQPAPVKLSEQKTKIVAEHNSLDNRQVPQLQKRLAIENKIKTDVIDENSLPHSDHSGQKRLYTILQQSLRQAHPKPPAGTENLLQQLQSGALSNAQKSKNNSRKYIYPSDLVSREALQSRTKINRSGQLTDKMATEHTEQGSGQKISLQNSPVFFDRASFEQELKNSSAAGKADDKSNANILYWARTWYHQKQYHLSERQYLRLIELNPLDEQYYLELSHFYFEIGAIKKYNSTMLRLYKIYMYKHKYASARRLVADLKKFSDLDTALLEMELSQYQ